MAFTGQLGDYGLGSFTLGGYEDTPPAGEEPASNTLSLSHSVALALICNPAATNNLALTQTPARNITVTKSADNTVTFTQTLKRILEKSASNTLVLSQTVIGDDVQPASNTLTLSHDVIAAYPRGRSVSQTITFSHSCSETEVRARSASNTLTLTQSVKLTHPRSVTHTQTFYQNIDVVLAKAASNTITFSQDVVEEHYKYRRVFANLEVTQQVTPQWVFDRSVSNTLGLTQDVRRIIDVDAENTLSLSHSETHVNSKYIAQSLTFTHSALCVRTYGRQISQTLALSHTIVLNRVINKRMYSLFQPSHGGRVLPIRNVTVTSNLTLSQELIRLRFAETSNSLLSLTQSVLGQRIINLAVTQNLNLTHAFVRNTILNRPIIQTLVFPPVRRIPIRIGDITEVLIPTAQATLIPNNANIITTPTIRRQRELMRLSVPEQTVVMPVPNFGNSEGNTDTFTMSKAIDGTTYTTVKRSGTRSIAYEWDISYPKAEELIAFVWEYNTRAITIHTWEGEIWVTRLITNPVTFTDELRPEVCESNSKFTVSLEFEGVRIH